VIESRTTGLSEVLEAVEQVAKTPRISAGCAADGGRPDGAQNVVVARTQAKQGRDPFFIDGSDEAAGDSAVMRMVRAWQSGNPDAAVAAARDLARIMVEAIKRHVAEQRGAEGPFKPLSERYKAIKEHVHKAGGKPILVRTGELLSSLTPKVSVRSRRG
jgi:hypothetical protein